MNADGPDELVALYLALRASGMVRRAAVHAVAREASVPVAVVMTAIREGSPAQRLDRAQRRRERRRRLASRREARRAEQQREDLTVKTERKVR